MQKIVDSENLIKMSEESKKKFQTRIDLSYFIAGKLGISHSTVQTAWCKLKYSPFKTGKGNYPRKEAAAKSAEVIKKLPIFSDGLTQLESALISQRRYTNHSIKKYNMTNSVICKQKNKAKRKHFKTVLYYLESQKALACQMAIKMWGLNPFLRARILNSFGMKGMADATKRGMS